MVVHPTGQPIMNPDGTMHKYTPGQPLPQQATGFNTGPQQQQTVYQTPQDWTAQNQVVVQGARILVPVNKLWFSLSLNRSL